MALPDIFLYMKCFRDLATEICMAIAVSVKHCLHETVFRVNSLKKLELIFWEFCSVSIHYSTVGIDSRHKTQLFEVQ
mgnify:CR=1 FL=1